MLPATVRRVESPVGPAAVCQRQRDPRVHDAHMRVTGIDHLVLTVASIPATVDFYTRVLGLEAFTFDGGRVALRLGEQKLNLHPAAAP
ncbi:VOC family protein, partial [Actinomyces sp. MRS3W]|uniref:VOC family protein n=1 Tax=Actinomyces sp. MRS3W TaxID=2800796 RepID=UPI0028FD6677